MLRIFCCSSMRLLVSSRFLLSLATLMRAPTLDSAAVKTARSSMAHIVHPDAYSRFNWITANGRCFYRLLQFVGPAVHLASIPRARPRAARAASDSCETFSEKAASDRSEERRVGKEGRS